MLASGGHDRRDVTLCLQTSDVFSVEVSTYLVGVYLFCLRMFAGKSVMWWWMPFWYISPKARLKMELVASFLTLGFCTLVTWKAADVAILNYQRFGFRFFVTLPLWIPYLVIALGAFGVVLQSIVQIRGLAGRMKCLSQSSEGEEVHKGGLM